MPRRDDGLYASMVLRGMSRRAFLKFSAAMATTLALPLSYAPRIAAAVTEAPRIPVIWLHGQACGGNTRALLQASDPTTAELLLDVVSVDYHETLMARSGASAEVVRRQSMTAAPNGYIAVVEGAIPMGDEGVYCTVGGRAFSEVVREVCGGAMATVALGSCAVDGGTPAAGGGTTGSVGVEHVVADTSTLINMPGCPVNIHNLAALIVHYATFKTLPVTDARHRPLFAYGNLLHNQCERRAHYEFGEYVEAWGDEGAQKGWCLYKMGCKGPETFANCPTVRYSDGTSWAVRAGHGCVGCTMPGFWDQMSPAYARLPGPLPFAPGVTADQMGMALVGGVAALTVVHGAASAVRLRRWDVEARRAAMSAEGGVVEGDVGAATTDEAVEVAKTDEAAEADEAPTIHGAPATREGAAEAPTTEDEAAEAPTTEVEAATTDAAATTDGGAEPDGEAAEPDDETAETAETADEAGADDPGAGTP